MSCQEQCSTRCLSNPFFSAAELTYLPQQRGGKTRANKRKEGETRDNDRKRGATIINYLKEGATRVIGSDIKGELMVGEVSPTARSEGR